MVMEVSTRFVPGIEHMPETRGWIQMVQPETKEVTAESKPREEKKLKKIFIIADDD